MSLQLPEGLAQALQAGQPLPQGLAPGRDDQTPDPLEVLQECIQGLHGVVAALPDPQDTHDAAQALLILTKVQKRLMGEQQGNGPQPQG